jgi:hypothetical protein
MKIKRLYRCKCTPKILGCGSEYTISRIGVTIPVREITLVLEWRQNSAHSRERGTYKQDENAEHQPGYTDKGNLFHFLLLPSNADS